MVDYKKISLKFQDTSKDFSFCFYYHEGTTIEDLLEYIIINFKEKMLCLCFQLYYVKNKKYYLIESNNTFKEYISKNDTTFYIYNPNGNKCQCNQITKNNFFKSRKEIIRQLIDNSETL